MDANESYLWLFSDEPCHQFLTFLVFEYDDVNSSTSKEIFLA
jgi:hypothetical protein